MNEADAAAERIQQFRTARGHWIDEPSEVPIRSYTLPRLLGGGFERAYLTDDDLGELLVGYALLATRVADYENRITWHTTCEQCATVLDRAIADFERAEKAEAKLADARQRLDTLRSVAEELEELPEICRHLVGPRCGEAVDRAREARRLVGKWTEASDKETT